MMNGKQAGGVRSGNILMSVWFSADQQARVKYLAQRLCANCCQGNCLLLDGDEPCACVQSISRHICCTYFRDVVLPRDWRLLGELMKDSGAVRCRQCGKYFMPAKKSRTRPLLYCPDCAKERQREQKRKFAAANRKAKKERMAGK